ncbi:RagB/SusD family nutrient uptake outer membrane protein [Paraflavitalea sp. CAU 1676]|uniref:RagB/SusD family nutrient uptake outer membrane protein n=1 Tax=Paraflavitalea sp. CAU 1676 TaxID=3032598 RepID=UPI0023DB40A2|nr:RagB/SusD family nutrient uptake outer membrane protein [Paraflavitalea sp. CAU 1676]MDF2189556.1 RagB/SusD family nutrient uptake outer membrane protein [Paraflavitalea sp. CAU 1676]
MKRLAIYSLAILPLVAGSCKKFLNKEYESVFEEEYVFGSEPDARKAVNAAYALFNQDAFTSRVSNNFTGNSDIEVGGVGASPDNSRRDIWSFEASDANADLLTVWNNAYSAINRANDAVEGITNSSIYKVSSEMKQLAGEAAALRAYWYYLLMNHWGDVPFKFKPTKSGDNFYLARTNRDSALTALIEDLRKYEPNMKWAKDLDFGIERMNREFVIGMIARLSLMRGGYWLYPDMKMKRMPDYLNYYKIANEYCKKLIELQPHNLNPDFKKIFYNECQGVTPLNDDVLYEVAFHPGFGDVGWCNGVKVDAGSHAYGSGSNYLSLPPSYYYSFDTLDKRLEVTCAITYFDATLQELPSASTSIAPGKWNRLWLKTPPGSASAKGTGINWPLMRYSDVLLMLAETENEINNGPTAAAKEALAKVRRRAFDSKNWAEKVDAYIAAQSSKDAFFEAIVDERAWEFGGECLRKYDLARWNNYGQKIAEAKKIMTDMGADAYGVGPGTYANLPDYLYYKKTDIKGVVWYSKYRKPAVAPPVVDVPAKGDNPTGYLRFAWNRSLRNTTAPGGPSDFIIRTWRGYKDESGVLPVRYILPLHGSVLTNSQGTLKNDGYGY